MNFNEKVITTTLRASMIGVRSGWVMVGIGIIGLGLVLISTGTGYAAKNAAMRGIS